MKGLLRVTPVRFRPFRDDEALARANGVNVEARWATGWAWRIASGILLLVLLRLAIGCTPVELRAAEVVARTAACTICGASEPDVREQVASLASGIATLTEAISVLAARNDSAQTAAILAALQERWAKDRADFERLVELAGAPAPAPSPPSPPPSPAPQ